MRNYIRYATKDDADIIAKINSESAKEGYKGIIPETFINDRFSFERLRDRHYKELEACTTTSCIMFSNDVPVGMQTFAKDDEVQRDVTEIDIWRIYLLPAYWGQNLGMELMDWGLRELWKEGYKKSALWVVEENARARRFYEKCGFSHDGEIRIIDTGKETREYRYTKTLTSI